MAGRSYRSAEVSQVLSASTSGLAHQVANVLVRDIGDGNLNGEVLLALVKLLDGRSIVKASDTWGNEKRQRTLGDKRDEAAHP